MQISTVLLIILAAVVAMLIVLFQYFYKQKNKGKLPWVLSFLRFLALFCVFILLINPKLTKKEVSLEKSNLIVLVDDSSSMSQDSSTGFLDSIIGKIDQSNQIHKRFNIEQFMFGDKLKSGDSLTFKEPRTDISNAIKSLNKIFSSRNGVILLMSDGNSTIGENYEFYGENQKFPIFPMVIGDTTSYEDLVINQVNANKYAFLKNKFPIEVFVTYSGNHSISSNLNIFLNGTKVETSKVELNESNNSITFNPVLEATSVGLKNIGIRLDPLSNEKNILNNRKDITIEVIDEKTNIAFVTDILHPDIGAIKTAIESNEQRAVTIYPPETKTEGYTDVDLFILYQPNVSFQKVYDYIDRTNSNTFTISGPATDWDYLNKVQKSFTKNSYVQTEEVTPVINQGYSIFDISNLSVENYPPLQTNLGEVIVNSAHEILLNQKVKGTEINEPLLVVATNKKDRDAILFGENIWKWRTQEFRENQNFDFFDELIGKIILYLSTDNKRKRLVLDYESLYFGVNTAKMTASYFDETYTFDPNANVITKFKEEKDNSYREVPLLLKGNYYETDLSNLTAGNYSFEVRVLNKNISKKGSFKILDFDVEQQFTSSNYKKLKRLAENTGARLYYPIQADSLINDLIAEDKFIPVQKSHENVVSLVDFKILLAIIIAALTIEWFIRKYNGLT